MFVSYIKLLTCSCLPGVFLSSHNRLELTKVLIINELMQKKVEIQQEVGAAKF